MVPNYSEMKTQGIDMKTLTIWLMLGVVGLTADTRLEASITSSSTQSQPNELALKKILKEMRSKIKQSVDGTRA